MKQKFLITGGCGFIGTNLIKELLSRGYSDIRIIDNLQNGNLTELQAITKVQTLNEAHVNSLGPKGVEFFRGDILDQDLANLLSKGCDIVVHLAANTGVTPSVEDPRADLMSNIIGTFNYLEAAKKNRLQNFVFASSSAPVGNTTPPIHEQVVPRPVSPYGSSKLAGEAYCSSYFRTYKLNTIALRFSNVFGPGSRNKSSVIAKIIKNVTENEPIKVYGSGDQTRDFIFIDDLVDAIIKAAFSKDLGGEIFQIATGTETSVNQIIEFITLHCKENSQSVPEIRYLEKRIGDVFKNYSDITKAKKYLHWEPKVCLSEALQKTIEYFSDVKYK